MAARWGAGEEILTACNMEFFSTNTLDETVNSVGLNSGEALEALHSCLDPSILSIFEDAPTGEAKGLDEESEATLLTALTEILDNVDDENLSPFDTLPDSDLLSGQKGREHSPLRRMMCLSRSPPEKDNTRSFSTGKSLPRTQPGSVQRSDGEEEEDGEASSLTLSPKSQPLSPEEELLCWGGLSLPLPLTLEQETVDGESVSLSLGDLVRHMHPYCMAVCVEGEEEQMLPEGGIFLEVVDQGEHGEPILAIPDMGLPLSFPHLSLPIADDSSEGEQKVPDNVSYAAILEMSEPVLVDVTAEEAPVEVACPVTLTQSSEVKDEKVIIRRPKEEMEEKSPSRRKKKRKNKEIIPVPVEGRVLRSSSARRAAPELPKKPVKETMKSEKEKTKTKVMFVPAVSVPAPVTLRHKTRPNMQHAETHSEITTLTTLPTHPSIRVPAHMASTSDLLPVKTTPEKSQPSLLPSGTTAERPSQPTEASKAPDCDKTHDFAECPTPQAIPQSNTQPPVPQESLVLQAPIIPNDVDPLATPQPSEPAPDPKPKSLNLQQYRLLRQQKKPAPMEKQEDHSTKWPSLPEPPKELPLIPCLPDPRDPRRPNSLPGKKELIEIKPAWQPMGPGAPPTPAALLVPPAYMVASSSKVATATPALKPVSAPAQQVAALQPAKVSQPPVATASSQVKSLPPTSKTPFAQHILPQTCGSLSAAQLVSPAEKPSPVDSRVTLLQSSPTLIPAETQKVVLQQQLTLSHSAPSASLAVIGASPQPQPSCCKPVVPIEAPSKTTTNIHKPNTIAAASAAVSPLKPTAATLKMPQLAAGTPVSDPAKASRQTFKPPTPASGVQSSPVLAVCPLIPSQCQTERPVGPAATARTTPTRGAPKAKSPTQELIEAFTTEIGIEAADLTSLLEQFEETQAKEEQCFPEVSGRAAAVGNSSVEQPSERTAVERVRGHDLASTAALTPPATPPHQMWKPLAPMTLLGKSKTAEGPKPSPSKAIQINARPLPSNKLRSKPTTPATPALSVAQIMAFSDHDYCLPQKEPPAGESGKRWNVKQQPAITIKLPTPTAPQQTPAASPQTLSSAMDMKTEQPPLIQPLDDRTDRALRSSVLETPDASPTRLETEAAPLERSPRQERSYRGYGTTCSPSPSPRPSARERKRGRPVKRVNHHSPSSGSSCSESASHSSQSRSRSPPRKRYRPRHSESSSSGSSCSSSRSSRSVSHSPPRRRTYSYSSSRSGSWSRSRSCSPRGRSQWRRDSRQHNPSQRPGYRHDSQENSEEVNRRKEKAIEERRVVYVGRIRGTMTRTELRDRFSLYGEIEECTLHFRDHGDNYGFVTYYDTKNAFTAIENGGKLRKPDELPFDLCFGGRRQFCRTSYADLDSNREYDPSPNMKGRFDALDFDTLLKQAQKNLKR